MNTFS